MDTFLPDSGAAPRETSVGSSSGVPGVYLYKVVHQPVVEVLTTQVSISSCGLDLEDALLDCEERNIKGSASKVKNEYVALANTAGLLVKSVRNGSSSGLIDDTHDIQARNDACRYGTVGQEAAWLLSSHIFSQA